MSAVKLPAQSRHAWTNDEDLAEFGDVARDAAGSLHRYEEDGYRDDFWKKVVNLGWHSVLLKEEFGGLELDSSALAAVVTPLAVAGCSHAYLGTALDAIVLLQANPSEGSDALLNDIAGGASRPVVALAESASEPYPLVPATRLERRESGWSLTGRKALVPYGGVADGFIVLALDADAGAPTLVYVPSNSEGLEVITHDSYGLPLSEVTFAEVAVAETGWLAAGATVRTGLESYVDLANAVDAVALVALGSEALSLTLSYTGERVQFDKPLAALQAVQHHCTNAFLRLEESRMLARDALTPRHDSVARAWASSLAAVKAGEGVIEVMRLAHRLHGGMGYYSDYPLEALTRRAVTIQGLHGSIAWHRVRLQTLITNREFSFERGELRSIGERPPGASEGRTT